MATEFEKQAARYEEQVIFLQDRIEHLEAQVEGAADAERSRVLQRMYAHADRIEAAAYDHTTGHAVASIIREIAGRIHAEAMADGRERDGLGER